MSMTFPTAPRRVRVVTIGVWWALPDTVAPIHLSMRTTRRGMPSVSGAPAAVRAPDAHGCVPPVSTSPTLGIVPGGGPAGTTARPSRVATVETAPAPSGTTAQVGDVRDRSGGVRATFVVSRPYGPLPTG